MKINRNIRRYLDIVRTLSKYGFSQILEMMGFSSVVLLSRRMFGRSVTDSAGLTAAERVRLALEEPRRCPARHVGRS